MIDSLVYAALAGFSVGAFFSVVSGVVRAISGSIYTIFSINKEE